MKNLFCLFIMLLNITIAKAELPKIVALVNNEPITLNEFQARKRMIMAFNNIDLNNSEKDKQLNKIVMKTLIDDTLLYQSTKNKPSDRELNEAICEIEQRNKMPKGQFIEFLKSKSIDINSFKSQIGAEIIKMNILSSFSKSITISPKEINTALLITNSKDAEISALSFTSKDKSNKTLSKMHNLQKNIKNCNDIKKSSYDSFARMENINQKISNIDSSLKTILKDLNTEEKSNVFETKEGFKLILMCNKKVVNITKDENEYVLNFLTNKKMSQKAQKYLDNMRKKAYIKIMIPQ
ncbi:MAG: SurA N-terminal domain-containing protein [Rickettsia endosymbiont of Bryobia graminum]|nr:SurA N-terminal domain-containing protein [Rickettsia endosymbiont of Bryobia graminum]